MTAQRGCRLALVAALLAGLAGVGLAGPGYACACGAIVAPGGTTATMNHEVALMHWNGSTETILMQLALSTTDNVALVVPTPTPAKAAAGTKATFAELDALTAPQIKARKHWTIGSLGASAPRDGVGARAPEVVDQVHLGPLEATTLAGGDLAGLKKWLADNGYSIRPDVSDALNPYVRDGWSFVAMRLTSSAPMVGGLDPVRLTFQSPQFVYPMRLSVAAPNPQQVTIFALSDHRQQRTDADAPAQSTQTQFAGNTTSALRDPLLRELAGNHGGYLTKMRVDISSPSHISSDFTFGNAANDEAYRQVVYVDHDSVIPIELIALAAAAVAAITATAIYLVVRRRRAAAGR